MVATNNQVKSSDEFNNASMTVLTVTESISAEENVTRTNSRFRLTKNTFVLILCMSCLSVALFLFVFTKLDDFSINIAPTLESGDFTAKEQEQRQLKYCYGYYGCSCGYRCCRCGGIYGNNNPNYQPIKPCKGPFCIAIAVVGFTILVGILVYMLYLRCSQ